MESLNQRVINHVMRSNATTSMPQSIQGLICYSFSKNSHAEQEMKMPPGTPRSRSFTRLTMRVSLPHFGHDVDFEVSMTFLRSAVFAIFTIQFS